MEIDKKIFFFINHGLKNNFFDNVMPFITKTSNWYIPLILFFTLLYFLGGEKGKKTIFLCIITVALADFITNKLIKEIFARPRPFIELAEVNRIIQAYGFSFPSSHAVNSFSLAMIFVYVWRKFWVIFVSLSIAALVGFSRIYVGVHYPLDVFGGFLFAILFCYFGIKIYSFIGKFYEKLRNKKQTDSSLHR